MQRIESKYSASINYFAATKIRTTTHMRKDKIAINIVNAISCDFLFVKHAMVTGEL